MKEMEFGAQLYTLRDLLTTKEDVEKTFAKVAAMGYKSVQVSGMKYLNIQQIKELSEKHDLKVVGAHVSIDRFEQEFETVMEEYSALGAPTCGVGSVGGDKFEQTADGVKKLTERLVAISEKMKPYNIKFTYHNHAFEFIKYDGKTQFDIMIEESRGADNFTFCYDTYWAQVGGVDVCEYIEKLAGRLPLLHLKDHKTVDWNNFTMCEIGQGTLNWKNIIETYQKTNPGGFMVVEQDHCDGCPLDSMKISIDYLMKNFG